MRLGLRRIARLPVLELRGACPACGGPVACELGFRGCWCASVSVSPETRDALRARYRGCLCRDCLEAASARGGAPNE